MLQLTSHRATARTRPKCHTNKPPAWQLRITVKLAHISPVHVSIHQNYGSWDKSKKSRPLWKRFFPNSVLLGGRGLVGSRPPGSTSLGKNRFPNGRDFLLYSSSGKMRGAIVKVGVIIRENTLFLVHVWWRRISVWYGWCSCIVLL